MTSHDQCLLQGAHLYAEPPAPPPCVSRALDTVAADSISHLSSLKISFLIATSTSLKTTFRLMQIMYKRLETRKARRQRKKNLRKRMYPLQLKENNNPIISKSLRILYFRLIPRMLLEEMRVFPVEGKKSSKSRQMRRLCLQCH